MTADLSRVFHVFVRAPGAHPLLTVLCVFFAGLFDVFGMSLVVPLLNVMASRNQPSSSPLSQVGQRVVDALGLSGDPPVILAAIAGALTLKALLILAAMAYVSYSMAEVGLRIRRSLLATLLRANLSYFTSLTPARIANALVNDANAATSAFHYAAVATAEFLRLTVVLLMAFLVAGWAILAVLAVAAIASALLSSSVRIRGRAFRQQKLASDRLIDRTADTFVNIKVLKGMGRLGQIRDSIGHGIAEVGRSVFRNQITRFSLNAMQDILLVLILCGGLYIGMTWLHLSVPELILLTTLFMLIGTAIRNLQSMLQQFREFLPAFEACEELLKEADANAERTGGRRAPDFRSAITFEGVSFGHGDRLILDQASLRIPAGSITVLEGASGVGKTTTVDLLAGLHVPSAGVVAVDAVPLDDIDMQAWRAGIGYVPQELTLVSGSVFENIALGDPRITREAALQALDTAGVGPLIRSLPRGIDTDVGTAGSKFSGGERQRLSLGRALAAKPRLLILDEVTSALDHATEHEICATVAALSPPLTIVAITHRPAWTKIASHVFRLQERKIVAASSPSPAESSVAGAERSPAVPPVSRTLLRT